MLKPRSHHAVMNALRYRPLAPPLLACCPAAPADVPPPRGAQVGRRRSRAAPSRAPRPAFTPRPALCGASSLLSPDPSYGAGAAQDQDFAALEEELEPPIEVLVEEGSVVFFHPFLLHDRSECWTEEPRRVLFLHYRLASREEERGADPNRFHPEHRAAMDGRQRRLCGLSAVAPVARL